MSEAAPPRVVLEPAETVRVRVTVNGAEREAEVPARRLLADFLRGDLVLTGTHLGCEHGICGACTVLVDGEPARSCTTLAAQVDGAEVTTIEGLAPRGSLSPMQEAFKSCHGLQCGFCTPGFLVSLSAAAPEEYPTDADIRELLAGHLCRCTGYEGIVAAVRTAWGRTNGTDGG